MSCIMLVFAGKVLVKRWQGGGCEIPKRIREQKWILLESSSRVCFFISQTFLACIWFFPAPLPPHPFAISLFLVSTLYPCTDINSTKLTISMQTFPLPWSKSYFYCFVLLCFTLLFPRFCFIRLKWKLFCYISISFRYTYWRRDLNYTLIYTL